MVSPAKISCQSCSSNNPFFKNILVSQDFYFQGSLYAIKELLCDIIFYWTIHSGNFPLTSDVSFRLNLVKKTRLMSLTHFTRFTNANYEDQHFSTRKNLFKPIYSKKYQVREKTNVEPLIPMGDQEIISPYSINTIYSKVYMHSSFFLLFSNWHVSDCDRYTEVCYGDKRENNEKKKN